MGVLVTRPRAQAKDLVTAIEAKGGRTICFPVIEIVPQDESDIVAAAASLPKPDIVIFISRNAVAHGLQLARGALVAAIGPSTAAAIRGAGQTVDIEPCEGFDSESLLAEAALQDVAGRNIHIVRGDDGRELLAETLRKRGATVNYLPVYERAMATVSPKLLAEVEAAWREGRIDAVIVMSVASLRNLQRLLPVWCQQQLELVPLVTPAARVIKEALDLYPASRPILASGPQAADMVEAMIAIHRTDPGLAP
jgi:uroporphyrinogen-III synthase